MTILGDIRLLALDVETHGSDGAAELAHILHCHLEPLIKHASRFLTKYTGDIPLRLALTPGTVDAKLCAAVKSCLGAMKISKTTRITLEDTGRPEDLENSVTSGTELACAVFARGVAPEVSDRPPPAPKKCRHSPPLLHCRCTHLPFPEKQTSLF